MARGRSGNEVGTDGDGGNSVAESPSNDEGDRPSGSNVEDDGEGEDEVDGGFVGGHAASTQDPKSVSTSTRWSAPRSQLSVVERRNATGHSR